MPWKAIEYQLPCEDKERLDSSFHRNFLILLSSSVFRYGGFLRTLEILVKKNNEPLICVVFSVTTSSFKGTSDVTSSFIEKNLKTICRIVTLKLINPKKRKNHKPPVSRLTKTKRKTTRFFIMQNKKSFN